MCMFLFQLYFLSLCMVNYDSEFKLRKRSFDPLIELIHNISSPPFFQGKAQIRLLGIATHKSTIQFKLKKKEKLDTSATVNNLQNV